MFARLLGIVQSLAFVVEGHHSLSTETGASGVATSPEAGASQSEAELLAPSLLS
jgi:hypothetical protein